MLIYAILALHEEIARMPLGANRITAAKAAEQAALEAMPTSKMKGLLR
jgi:NADH-quinone oxidoreductase subunit B